MLQRISKDPGFWFLVLMNSYLIYYYLQQPGEFNTIIWIYWMQSVLIGLFNFVDLMTIKNPDESSMKMNNQPVTTSNMGCAAWFFLFHFGFFHFVYAIFLLTSNLKGANGKIILITAGLFLAESTIQMIRKKRIPETEKVNVGKMFMTPYLRIIPMHLVILLPSLFALGTSIIFLLLKMVADIGMYLLTTQKDFSLTQTLKRLT